MTILQSGTQTNKRFHCNWNMYLNFRILLSQCNVQMKISFSGLIFMQYKSINKYYVNQREIKWFSLALIDSPSSQSSDFFRTFSMDFHWKLMQMEAAVMKHHQSLFLGKLNWRPTWLSPWHSKMWKKSGKQPTLTSLQELLITEQVSSISYSANCNSLFLPCL